MNRIDFIRIAAAALIALMAIVAAFGAPHFVTPEMTLRNGLTDEQYENLWAMGARPRIDPQAARDWVFRASRYANATNWFAVIGRTNDFARLCMVQKDAIHSNEATIAALDSALRRDERQIAWLTNYVGRLEAEIAEKNEALRNLGRDSFVLSQEMTNGLYAIEKTDRFYEEREKSAPDEKLRTIYHEMRDYLGIIRREFETPPNTEGETR